MRLLLNLHSTYVIIRDGLRNEANLITLNGTFVVLFMQIGKWMSRGKDRDQLGDAGASDADFNRLIGSINEKKRAQ